MLSVEHGQSRHGACIAMGLQALAQTVGMRCQKRDQGFARTEHRVRQTRGQKSAVGGQSQHGGLIQAGAQAVDGFGACGRVGDQFAQHRIVVRRDHAAHLQGVVKAQTLRRCKGQHGAGLWREVFVFGAQPDLDGVALPAHIGLLERQRFAACDAQLPLHQVEPGEHLGHWVFHLQPCVHLHQIKGLVTLRLVEQELHRPRAHIAR